MKTNVLGLGWLLLLCVSCDHELSPSSIVASNVPKKLLMELEDKSKVALGGHPSTLELSELLKDAVDGEEIYAWDVGEAGLRLFHMNDGSLGVLTKGAQDLRLHIKSLKIGETERVKSLDVRDANLSFKTPLVIGDISTENYTYSVVTFPFPQGVQGIIEFRLETGRLNIVSYEWVAEKSYRLTVNVNHEGPKMVGILEGLSEVSATANE